MPKAHTHIVRTCILLIVALLAQTEAVDYYWHGISSNFNSTLNWKTNQDGTGTSPPGGLYEDFNDNTLASAWTTIDQDNWTGSSISETGGQLVLAGRGADIWLGDNAFVGIYRSDITGDFDISVKIVSQTNSNAWAKSGFMVANDFTDLTQGGYAIVCVAPGNNFIFQYDISGNIGEIESWAGAGTTTYPGWVRIVKSGTSLTAYYKTAVGNAWNTIGATQTPQGSAESCQIALVSTSHNVNTTCTAIFDDFFQEVNISDSYTLSFNGTGTGSDMNATLTEDISTTDIDFTGYTGTMDFAGYTITSSGSATYSSTMTITPNMGGHTFNGTGGTQVFTVKSGATHPAIAHIGESTFQITGGGLITNSFYQSAGILDFNGNNITTVSSGDFVIENGTSVSITGLGGRTITAAGNVAFGGTAGDSLDLDPGSAWTVNAGDQLTAVFSVIGSSNASGQPGTAYLSRDATGNSSWSFASQTFYWHGATDDFNLTTNWTTNPDGTGANPSGAPENFNDGILAAEWNMVDYDNWSGSSVIESGGAMKISARGTDVWNASNEFVGAYRTDVPGNFDVSVKVISQTNSNPWAKCGIMAANDFTNLPSGGYVIVCVTPSNNFALQWDASGNVGELESNTTGGASLFPCWLRLRKSGTSFSGYYKTSLGGAWTQIGGAVTPQLTAANSNIGFFVTSHSTTTTSTVQFDNFDAGKMGTGIELLSFNGTGTNSDANATIYAELGVNNIDFTGYTGIFNFDFYTLTISGDATFASGNTVTPGSGAMVFSAGSGTQTFTAATGITFPDVEKTGNAVLRLAGADATVNSYTQSGGTLDFNGYDLSTTNSGNITIANGTSGSFAGLGGRTITVAGATDLTGQSSDFLNMNPTSPWTLASTGSLDASFANLGNSNASVTPGIAINSINSGNNTNWSISGTYTWDGGGADNNWNTAGNWTNDAVPGAQDSVIFSSLSTKNCVLDGAATVKSIVFGSGYTGNFDFSTNTMSVTGVANFSTGGTISASSGTLAFSGTASQSFIPGAGQTFPDIIQNGAGGTTVGNANLTAGTLTISSGVFDLGDNGKSRAFSTLTASGGGLDFGTATTAFSGNADFSSLGSLVQGTGTLVFNGSSTQTLTPKTGSSFPNLTHSGSGTLALAASIDCIAFANSSGTLDLNSYDITTSGNFTVSGGTPSTFADFVNTTITVGGNASFVGTSAASRLNLNTASPGWTINAGGNLTATYVNMAYSTASGSGGEASGSVDGGNNVGWTFDDEDYATWTYSRSIYFNTTSSGGNVSGDVTSFPMLVKLTTSNFTFAQANSGGTDIRFAKTDGTHLKYEIEQWTDGVSAFIWVLVDTVYGNNNTQKIKMYWGNGSATDNSDGSAVFATADGHVGVWHMGGTADATSNGLSASKYAAGQPADATGIIGGAQDFDGVDDYMTVADNAALDMGSTFTVSVWTTWESGGNPTYGRLISRKTAWDGADGFEITGVNGNNTSLDMRGTGSNNYQRSVVSSWSSAAWYHIAYVFNGTTVKVYANGVLKGTGTITAIVDNNNQFAFGENSAINEANWNGKMDEIRFNDNALSDDYIKLCYESQKSGSTVISTSPIVSGLDDTTWVSAYQSDKNTVTIKYEIEDPDDATVTVSAEYEIPGSNNWITLTNTSGDIGAGIDATSGTTDRTITWTVSSQLPDVENTYRVRVIADDGSFTGTTESQNFSVDTKAPVSLAGLALSGETGTTVDVSWTAASDGHFSHYEIWYGTVLLDVQNRDPSVEEWDYNDDPALSSATTTSTTITGLTQSTTYYFKIWAVDSVGNELTITYANTTTPATVGSIWNMTSVGDISGGAITSEGRLYLGTGGDSLMLSAVNTANGSKYWKFSTASYGACNSPSYYYSSNGKYKVFASAGNYVIGRQDDGGSSSQLFPPVNLSATAGNPYASPDDASLFVAGTNKLTKINISDGSVASGWPQTITGVSTSADPIVKDDVVLVTTAAGVVNTFDADGTPGPSSTFDASAAISLPLLGMNEKVYVTPSTAELYALNASNLTDTWSGALNVTDAHTGPAFSSGADVVYIATGSNIRKITDNGGSGTVSWTFAASGAISSSPVMHDGVVYFGTQDGSYCAIDDTPSALAQWPVTSVQGQANHGPWIDLANSYVLFATDAGRIDAFNLE